MFFFSYFRLSICVVVDGRYLYVIGGNLNSGFLDIVERYDLKEKVWYIVVLILEKWISVGGVVVNKKFYVFGGLCSKNYLDLNFCEIYDLIIDVWNSVVIVFCIVFIGKNIVNVVSFRRKIFVCYFFDDDF